MGKVISLDQQQMNHRAILSKPSPSARAKNKLEGWFDSHPEALAFVDEWLRMKAVGETSWGARSVIAHMREHWDYPFTSDSALTNWVGLYRRDHAGSKDI